MRIVNNISAMNTHRVLQGTDNAMGKNLEKLSSGLRINRAADDAAGLAISEKMRNQISGTKQAMRNAQDGISMIQTAEGALNETHAILNRMRDLAVQAKNGTLQDDDRDKLNKEFTALQAELNRISDTTEFNTKKLLDGSKADGVIFHVGANTGQPHEIAIHLNSASADALGVGGSSVGTAVTAKASIDAIDTAISRVSDSRGHLGAVQNRLEHTINNLGVISENLASSESRIRDVDMAEEMTQFSKNQILTQSATAMLAQANAKPQSVLKLLS
ncbi:MAG: flagellin [Bacillota bacterium]|jgi:flagellin